MRYVNWMKFVFIALIGFAAAAPSTAENAVFSGTGSWDNQDNWDGGLMPSDGDSVTVRGDATITESTPLYSSFTVESGNTVTFDGWDTKLSAAEVIINGTLTHAVNSAVSTNSSGEWIPNARVHVVCTDMTISSSGKIDVNGKGFIGGQESKTRGSGPGHGKGDTYPEGGGYGGRGGYGGEYRNLASYGSVYGSAEAPEMPGSGGGGGMNIPGGNGGGAVRIEAAGTVTVNGQITADGKGHNGHYSGGGSGGAVYITCLSITGSGTVSAAGENTGTQGGAGGGGRISVIYDSLEQKKAGIPQIKFSAAGSGEYRLSEPGTLFFTDSRFLLQETGAIRHSGTWMAPGMGSSWERDSLSLDGSWLRFPQENFVITVTNDLNISGSVVYLCRLQLTNSVINVGGSMTVNRGVVELFGNSDAKPSLSCAGDIAIKGKAEVHVYAGMSDSEKNPGAAISSGGTITVSGSSFIYPHSHPTNGASVHISAKSFVVDDADSGVNANGLGFAGAQVTLTDGFGPGHGKGTTYPGGGGYGGKGGGENPEDYGAVYGHAVAPLFPGSGGGGSNVPAGNGGGLIRIDCSGDVVVNGKLLANGTNGSGWHYIGCGSGGGVFISCKTFSGTGIIQADGHGSTSIRLGGGGGGGRIAVWLNVPSTYREQYLSGEAGGALITDSIPEFTGTISAGIGEYSKDPQPEAGSIVFLIPPPEASMILIF